MIGLVATAAAIFVCVSVVYLRPGEVAADEGEDGEAAECRAQSRGLGGQTQSVVAEKTTKQDEDEHEELEKTHSHTLTHT